MKHIEMKYFWLLQRKTKSLVFFFDQRQLT